MASPLFGLLTKDSDLCCSSRCQEALEILKENLTTAPILSSPNWALPFHIHNDASKKDVGVALGKIDDKFPYEIYFISKNMSKAKLNNIATEKELLVVVHPKNIQALYHWIPNFYSY